MQKENTISKTKVFKSNYRAVITTKVCSANVHLSVRLFI